jgi:glyoxylase-like metal-dependent hydrolase (beta-lactamase superfamily II)
MNISAVVSMPFEENTFIASIPLRDDCLVVDPGLEPDKVIRHLEQAKLVPAAILNTHGHSDHIAGNGALKQRWPDCPLVIGQGDAPKLTDSTKNLSAPFGLEVLSPEADVTVSEGQKYAAAGCDLDVLEIPGHSCGHVVYVWKGGTPWVVFGGDVLFLGSVGRTDFPDGSFQQLATAIHAKLFTLPDDTMILPGHGPATTVGKEKQDNPFVGIPSGYRP